MGGGGSKEVPVIADQASALIYDLLLLDYQIPPDVESLCLSMQGSHLCDDAQGRALLRLYTIATDQTQSALRQGAMTLLEQVPSTDPAFAELAKLLGSKPNRPIVNTIGNWQITTDENGLQQWQQLA